MEVIQETIEPEDCTIVIGDETWIITNRCIEIWHLPNEDSIFAFNRVKPEGTTHE